MSIALAALVILLIGGVAWMRGYGAHAEARRSRGVWLGLGLLAFLFLGLWVSGQRGHESAAYGFGIAMVLVGLVMVLDTVASALGRAMRQRKKGGRSDPQSRHLRTPRTGTQAGCYPPRLPLAPGRSHKAPQDVR